MGNIKNEVFLGTREMQNKKFELLAKMAQPEIWTYKKNTRNRSIPHFAKLFLFYL